MIISKNVFITYNKHINDIYMVYDIINTKIINFSNIFYIY